MDQFYRIAGLTVKMNTFGHTAQLAQPYRLEDGSDADITVVSDYRLLKQRHPGISDNNCEYIASGRSFYQSLIDYDGFMLHASAIAVDGRAYLFSADSGTGKSTHTDLWRQILGEDRVCVINDDKPALRRQNGVWYAYGTPWSGKHGRNQNTAFPVGGICFLERGETNTIRLYDNPDLVFRFLSQTYRFVNRQTNEKLLQLIGDLIGSVNIWQLKCNMDPQAAQVAYSAMSARNPNKPQQSDSE